MKTYRAKYNPDAKNVYGVSLVENPAMEGDFIQFSKQKLQFADVDKDKRRVMGLILEPNKLIYRNQGGSEFNIVFTEDDIENVAYNFQKQANQSTSTIEHSNQNIEGVTFVETWLVENPKVDKSTNFGFSYPKGSWMGVMQLDNDDVWNDYVKSGKVKGFSIDAFMQLEEVNLKQVDNMSEIKEDSLANKIVEGIKLFLKPEKAEETKEVELKQDETKEPEKVDLKDEVKEVKLNEGDLASILAEIDKLFAPLKDENVALKEQVKEIETKLSEQNETLVKLAKEPATKTIRKGEDKEVDFDKMSELEKRKYYRKQNG
ncbi:XkdF-like putative serine protease domain-containing protein [Polaribacter sp.]|uniref:XkdF-like putative serine protease domain-containing protein n=1 Tax=Polaribacter sp. TaxID=1920175 RepID=UPI003F6C587B